MSDWNGRWRNELGSEMTLHVDDGIASGTYRTQVGRPDEHEEFRLAGIVRRDMIAWTVDFGAHGSLTAWTGRLVDGDDPHLLTLWHLVRDEDDAGEPLSPWSSTLAGSAAFRRVD
jgi:hypothetical protein